MLESTCHININSVQQNLIDKLSIASNISFNSIPTLHSLHLWINIDIHPPSPIYHHDGSQPGQDPRRRKYYQTSYTCGTHITWAITRTSHTFTKIQTYKWRKLSNQFWRRSRKPQRQIEVPTSPVGSHPEAFQIFEMFMREVNIDVRGVLLVYSAMYWRIIVFAVTGYSTCTIHQQPKRLGNKVSSVRLPCGALKYPGQQEPDWKKTMDGWWWCGVGEIRELPGRLLETEYCFSGCMEWGYTLDISVAQHSPNQVNLTPLRPTIATNRQLRPLKGGPKLRKSHGYSALFFPQTTRNRSDAIARQRLPLFCLFQKTRHGCRCRSAARASVSPFLWQRGMESDSDADATLWHPFLLFSDNEERMWMPLHDSFPCQRSIYRTSIRWNRIHRSRRSPEIDRSTIASPIKDVKGDLLTITTHQRKFEFPVRTVPLSAQSDLVTLPSLLLPCWLHCWVLAGPDKNKATAMWTFEMGFDEICQSFYWSPASFENAGSDKSFLSWTARSKFPTESSLRNKGKSAKPWSVWWMASLKLSQPKRPQGSASPKAWIRRTLSQRPIANLDHRPR